MRANSSFDLEPHGAKRLCRRQASVIGRAQQCLGGVKVDAQHMALSNDLPTRCPNLYHMGRGGAGEQQVFGGHGHQGVAVKTADPEFAAMMQEKTKKASSLRSLKVSYSTVIEPPS